MEKGTRKISETNGGAIKGLRINLGKAKFYLDRARNYIGTIAQVGSFVMLLMMNQISLWWVMGGLVLVGLFMWKVDAKHIAPAEFEQMFKINPAWDKLIEAIKQGREGDGKVL